MHDRYAGRDIRWGIVGPGRIAANIVGDFPYVPGAALTAVASRSQERADAFAAEHDVERAHGSYRSIIDDPEIDVLYIATPHPQHRNIALAAIEAGKALLVEKTFTATVAGAEQIIDAASRADVFVMEAMWTRFQPVVVKMRELIADGAIGEVRAVQADLGVSKPFDATDRLYDPAQGGGAMLDLGVYVVSFAQMVLGTPASVAVRGPLASTGVESEAGLLLGYDDGRSAALTISLHSPQPGQARVFGTQGWIDVLPRFHHPNDIVLHRQGHDAEPINVQQTGVGYAHELIEVNDCLRRGLSESTVMPLADTLDVQRVLNDACEQLGVHHFEDETAI